METKEQLVENATQSLFEKANPSVDKILAEQMTELTLPNGMKIWKENGEVFAGWKEKKCVECGLDDPRVLTEARGKGIWSCWDCDNRNMQEEENRAIDCGNNGSCFE